MKENVIIGKLIPAGTGMKRYRNVKIDSELDEREDLVFDDFEEFDDYQEESLEEEYITEEYVEEEIPEELETV